MDDNIVKPIVTGGGVGDTCGVFCDNRINRNFCSSTLFLAPAVYGYLVNYTTVMWGSIICFLTSTAHHYYKAQNKILRVIDILTVNGIAAYFILYAFMNIGCTFYANIMYALAIAALSFYFFFLFNPHLCEKYYCLVHILAITGIMFYIKAYTECKKVK